MSNITPYSPASRRKLALASKTGSSALGNLNVPAGRLNQRSGNLILSHSEPLIGNNGEFNGSTKREIAQAGLGLKRAIDNGSVAVTTQVANSEVRAARQRALEEALADAQVNGTNSRAWLAIGEVIGDEIFQSLGRDGFSRKTLLIRPLGKGEVGRLRVRKKDVVAYYVSNDPNIVASQVRQSYVYPPEFYLAAKIVMEDREIEQSSGDLLQDKYEDGLEQLLVSEDKVWLNLSRTAASASNDVFFFNTFTPTVFSQMRTEVARWGIPVTTAVVAYDLWNDILTDAEFSAYVDPVSKHEMVLDGSIGSFLGVQFITDGYRAETLRVLSDGEVFMLGAPQTLGGITVRKDLMTKNIDLYNQGKPERGWFMEQIEGMAIVNSRAVTRGQRV